MQDRFHTLIKHRLRAEIERRPPLFPWESEVRDYEAQPQELGVPVLVPTRLWLNQLHDLTLPVPMPEPVLVQLFDRCQAVIQTSLRQGARLVQAVEKIFPGQPQVLNHLAGLVLTSPTRSGTSTGALAGMPAQYETATELQQMALSLMAAREILDSLTLTVSAETAHVERQWQTSMGQLRVQATLSPQSNQLRIQADLPCAGQIELKDTAMTANAERANAGILSVELFDLQLDRSYPLLIQFHHQDATPLIFAIQPITTDTAS
ncbi:MAG: PatU [Leptolyngbyaceae cyanobacterium SL_7_1]|nr:PatU [Leptolyngbyaceae cyanobacterium SL_7_1]